MSEPSVRAEIEAIETKINAGLQEDPTGQNWRLQLAFLAPPSSRSQPWRLLRAWRVRLEAIFEIA